MGTIVDTKGGALERMPDRPLTAASSMPLDLVRLAIERGDGIDVLNQLMALQERQEANDARRAFNSAFAAFKSKAVKIVKGTQIKDGPLKGKFHANLFDVVSATTEPLAEEGLSLSWKLTKDDKDWMEITCTLRHSAGHSESVSMGAAPDTGPGRNAIQARGSAKSYLERYTATAILGLAATEDDDDGNGAGEHQQGEQIDDAQRHNDMKRSAFVLVKERLHDSILVIRESLKGGKLDAAAEAWFELTDDEKKAIWVSPKACKEWGIEPAFTTAERDIIKSPEFRKAYYGDEAAA